MYMCVCVCLSLVWPCLWVCARVRLLLFGLLRRGWWWYNLLHMSLDHPCRFNYTATPTTITSTTNTCTTTSIPSSNCISLCGSVGSCLGGYGGVRSRSSNIMVLSTVPSVRKCRRRRRGLTLASSVNESSSLSSSSKSTTKIWVYASLRGRLRIDCASTFLWRWRLK